MIRLHKLKYKEVLDFFIFLPLSLFLLVLYSVFRRYAIVPIVVGAIGHIASEVPIQLNKALELGYRGILVIRFGNSVNTEFETFLEDSRYVKMLDKRLTRSVNYLTSRIFRSRTISQVNFHDFRRVEKVRHIFPISEEIKIKCQQALEKEFGKINRPIVLICCRDSAYDTALGRSDVEIRFRNSSFEIFYDTCVKFYELGYWVIRFGSMSDDRDKSAIDKYIFDYTKSDLRSESMDIYLSSIANLVISTGTGIEELPALFGKEIIKVNYLPAISIPSAHNRRYYLPKILCDASTGRVLNLDEILALGAHSFWKSSEYLNAGVSVSENSSQVIWSFIQSVLNIDGRPGLFEYYGNKTLRELVNVFPEHLQDSFFPYFAENWENLRVSTQGDNLT